MSAVEPTPAPGIYRSPWCECRYDIATGYRIERCWRHQPTQHPFRRDCADCKRSYDDVDNDALCVDCRAARTAVNLKPAACPRKKPDGTVCGNPIEAAVYRPLVCTECSTDDLLEDVRRYGSE